MTPQTSASPTPKSASFRTLLLVALSAALCGLTGCPDRPTNRGTDVPVHAGDRFKEGSTSDASGTSTGTSDASRTSKDAGRDSSANADEKPAGSTEKR